MEKKQQPNVVVYLLQLPCDQRHKTAMELDFVQEVEYCNNERTKVK